MKRPNDTVFHKHIRRIAATMMVLQLTTIGGGTFLFNKYQNDNSEYKEEIRKGQLRAGYS